MITLPKEWANSVGLNKNDTVGVQAQPDGTLLLYPRGTQPPSPKRTTKVIDVTAVDDLEFFYRKLVGAYISGHTTLMIKSTQPMPQKVTELVSRFVHSAIGLEMIEVDESNMLVANLIDHEAVDVNKIIKRMGTLTKNIVNDLYIATHSGEIRRIEDIREKDTEVDRIYWLTHRQYNTYQNNMSTKIKDRPSLHEFTTCLFLSRILERISDYAVGVSGFIGLMQQKGYNECITDEVFAFRDRALDVITGALKSWTEKDLLLAEETIKEANILILDAEQVMLENNMNSHSPVNGVMSFTTIMMGEYSKYIAEFAFNVSMD